MKKYIFLFVLVLGMAVAHAQSYTYLNFNTTDAAVTQVATQGLKITFNDGVAVVTVGDEVTEIPLATLDYMEFTNTEYSAGGGMTGDLDGNGVVDVEDLNIIINIILQLGDSGDYPGEPDVDGSGVVDIEDVNAIINLILKQ